MYYRCEMLVSCPVYDTHLVDPPRWMPVRVPYFDGPKASVLVDEMDLGRAYRLLDASVNWDRFRFTLAPDSAWY